MYIVEWATCTYPDCVNCTVYMDEQVLNVLQRTQCQLTPRLISMMCMHSLNVAQMNQQPSTINHYCSCDPHTTFANYFYDDSEKWSFRGINIIRCMTGIEPASCIVKGRACITRPMELRFLFMLGTVYCLK